MELLDSSVLIDYLRGHAEARAVVDVAAEPVASELTRYEVLSGVKPGEETLTEDVLALPAWVDVDEAIARRAAELARHYRTSFSGIEDSDYLIAATALDLGARLVTTNVKHFPMFPDLTAPY